MPYTIKEIEPPKSTPIPEYKHDPRKPYKEKTEKARLKAIAKIRAKDANAKRFQVVDMVTGMASKPMSLKKAKEQISILHTGEGVYEDAKNFAKRGYQSAVDFGKKVIYGRQGLSPKVNRILEEMGDAVIQSATIGRSPVQSFITNIIKVVSSTPYEKLFHLFIILHTNKGDVLLEKNEVINMQKGGAPKNSELIEVPSVPAGLTVQQLVDNTAKYMGNDFIPYAAGHNNCQDFQMAVLTSNNMITPQLKEFVKQDTTDIFKSPWFRKLAHSVTDLAGRANVIMQGGVIGEKDSPVKPKKNKASVGVATPIGGGTELIVGGENETTGADLEEMLKGVKSFKGVFIKDDEAQIRRALRNGGFVIINLNGTSHWCVLAVGEEASPAKPKKSGKNGRNRSYYWFDPFGFAAPLEIEYIIPKDYIYSSDEIQCMKTTSCGFYAVAFIKFMDRFGMTLDSYNKFQDQFKKSPQHNEEILKIALETLDEMLYVDELYAKHGDKIFEKGFKP
jgi:hypothetical protein